MPEFTRRHPRRFPALAFALSCGVMSFSANAGETSLTLGAEYSSGDYGTASTTRMWYFPATLKYETGRSMLSLTIPFIAVEGTGNVVASGSTQGMPRTTTTQAITTESGLGDIELAASHLLVRTDDDWRLDLGGRIKFGTADEQDNLSTGEDDVSVQLDLEKAFTRNSVFGTVGYKVLGDPPGINYENVFYGSAGFSHRLDATRDTGMEWYVQQAPLDGAEGKSELTLFLGGKPAPQTRLTGYLLAGFADGSPDWGLGVTLKLSH